jgi:hypothetical protein
MLMLCSLHDFGVHELSLCLSLLLHRLPVFFSNFEHLRNLWSGLDYAFVDVNAFKRFQLLLNPSFEIFTLRFCPNWRIEFS